MTAQEVSTKLTIWPVVRRVGIVIGIVIARREMDASIANLEHLERGREASNVKP
jgi:hypothetical protein